jgi:hypothetical protein
MTSDNISCYDDEKKEILAEALNLFKNAKNVQFRKENEIIYISYEIDNIKKNIAYDTTRGVLNGR